MLVALLEKERTLFGDPDTDDTQRLFVFIVKDDSLHNVHMATIVKSSLLWGLMEFDSLINKTTG